MSLRNRVACLDRRRGAAVFNAEISSWKFKNIGRKDWHTTTTTAKHHEGRKYVQNVHCIPPKYLTSCTEPKSKRQPVRLRHKIEKASAQKQKKAKKLAKKVSLLHTSYETSLT